MQEVKRIKELKNRLKEIEPIVSQGFKTNVELMKHYNENQRLYEEAKKISTEIRQLELELLTPLQQERQKKIDSFLELKAKGEPFDLTELKIWDSIT